MTNVVITSAARTGVGSFDESFSNIPAHDLEPEEIARCVAFRASDDAGFMVLSD
jgi:acetyl-CoA C-acetyltransferase